MSHHHDRSSGSLARSSGHEPSARFAISVPNGQKVASLIVPAADQDDAILAFFHRVVAGKLAPVTRDVRPRRHG